MKGSNLRYSLACSQNKALNNHQRKVGWLWTGPSPPEGREAGMRQPEPEGEGPSQPQSQHPPKTVSRLPVANHDFLGSWMVEFCQEERHMAHLRWCSCGIPRKPSGWEVIKMHRPPGTLHSPSTWSIELLGPGKAQNAGPIESVSLWSIQEPAPDQLRPGKCTKSRAHLGQFPCRATRSLSSLDRENTCAVSWDKPSMVHTL